MALAQKGIEFTLPDDNPELAQRAGLLLHRLGDLGLPNFQVRRIEQPDHKAARIAAFWAADFTSFTQDEQVQAAVAEHFPDARSVGADEGVSMKNPLVDDE